MTMWDCGGSDELLALGKTPKQAIGLLACWESIAPAGWRELHYFGEGIRSVVAPILSQNVSEKLISGHNGFLYPADSF